MSWCVSELLPTFSIRDTKIELKYGKDDPISEDVQLIAKVTGKISDKALELQAFFNWQKPVVPTAVVWVVLLLLALGHSFVPWRFLFYWIFRVGLFVGWFVATVAVPLLRIFPTATIKARRFFTSRGFMAHIKPRYTTAEGSDTHLQLGKAEKELLLNIGVPQMVRADRELVERGQWGDLFFYPTMAVLRTGHTTHVRTFLRPINVLLTRFAMLNPAFDLTHYLMRHLHSVTTVQGGKVVVFDVPAVRLEFQQNPNLAFHFYRWLACTLTKKNDRRLGIKQSITEAEAEAEALQKALEEVGGESGDIIPPKQDILQLRASEKRRQLLATLRDKFGVSPDEAVLHVAGDVYRRHLGKKFYGNVFVTMHFLAFLPSNIAQHNERWIAEAHEILTAFVDKNGSLEVLFTGNEVRHLYHDDRNVLSEIVSHLNQMKTAAEAKKTLFVNAATTPESSPPVKRHNIRAAVAKTLQKSASKSLLRGSTRGTQSARRTSSPLMEALPSMVSDLMSRSQPLPSAPEAAELKTPLVSGDEGARTEEKEEGDAPQADLSEQAVAAAAGHASKGLQAEGTPSEWAYVRITDVLENAMVRKLLDKRMKREVAAGSLVLPQDVSREVAIHVLWKGSAKAVRLTPGKPDLFIGYINEGSLFGEVAYLLESNSAASVVAVTDCTIYSLPGLWLDGLFDMDRTFGAHFFELVCLVVLERNVLSEQLLYADKTVHTSRVSSEANSNNNEESEGL